MKIVIYLYPGVTLLDAIGPYEVLRNVPGVDLKFVAKSRGNIPADSHLTSLKAQHRIKDVKSADVLLIPGSTISFVREMRDKTVQKWIQQVNETTQWTTTVCTGSLILAATGLLKGRKATSHWRTLNMLEEYESIPVQHRWIEDGKFITAAGVSAGIDMALYLADKISGPEASKVAQLMIEYDPSPMFKAGNASQAEDRIKEKAQHLLEEEAKKDLGFFEKIWSMRTLRKLLK